MKTVFKLLGCLLFASAAVSLQGYVLENRTEYRIDVYTTEAYPHNKEQTIPLQSAVVSWICKSGKDIPPVKNFWLVTLEPGQKVEIILGENRTHCNVEVCYAQKDYDLGWTEFGLQATYSSVAADEEMVFIIGKPKLMMKENVDNFLL